jgi:hypothetical protein
MIMLTAVFRYLMAGVLATAAVSGAAAQPRAEAEPDSPEPVLRALVTAMYAGDVAAYERLTLPHPLRSRLTAGAQPNEDRLRDLREDPEGLQIEQQRGFTWQGQEASIGRDGRYPDGTSAIYTLAHRGGPMIVGVTRRADGWKVDLRWWLAAMAQAQGGAPDRNSADFAVRSLLAAMLRLDRQVAAGLIADRRSLELLFAGAPSQREPSGVLDAMVGEMPLVEIAAGEFYPTPTGQVIEGGSSADRKVLVGWFGPIEMPFVVRRIDGRWKIVGEPYFAMMNQ